VRDSLRGDGVDKRLLDSVYQMLEARGVEVYLVNAQHVKNVPGRKTDVSDCPLGWPAPCQFPTAWIHLRHAISLATSRQPDSNGS
jgi:hypothetical protein